MAKDNRHFALRERTFVRTCMRIEAGRPSIEGSVYKNPQHAARRADAEFGAYDRNAAKRTLVLELDGAYMAAPEESL